MNRKEFVSKSARAVITGLLATNTLGAGLRAAVFAQPVALITGCSSDMGRQMAMTFARAGYKTYASMRATKGRNANSARDLSEWAGVNKVAMEAIELDITSPTQVQSVVDTIIAKESRIDVLINNAGVLLYSPMEIVTRDMWAFQMNTNVFGPMGLTGLVVPHMRYRSSGLVIQVSSFVGRAVIPGISLYASSKFALEAASEALHYETKPDGIDIAIVQPTPFDTNINRNARKYFRELSLPSIERERRWGSEHQKNFLDQLDRNFAGQPTRSPQEVADLALSIALSRREERLLRYPVGDFDTQILREINRFTSGIQQQVLTNSGYGQLFRT